MEAFFLDLKRFIARELKIVSETFSSELAAIQADVQGLTAAVSNAVSAIAALRGDLANAGVSADQLAALDAIHQSLAGATTSLANAVTPPAADTTTSGAGNDTVAG